jgi:hypothetical protein
MIQSTLDADVCSICARKRLTEWCVVQLDKQARTDRMPSSPDSSDE